MVDASGLVMEKDLDLECYVGHTNMVAFTADTMNSLDAASFVMFVEPSCTEKMRPHLLPAVLNATIKVRRSRLDGPEIRRDELEVSLSFLPSRSYVLIFVDINVTKT